MSKEISTMSSILENRKVVAAVMMSASGAAALFYIWKYVRSSQGDQDELDIPDSLYSQIKYLAKQSFKNRTLILVESVTDWDRAYTLLSKDLQQIKVLGMDTEWVTREKKRQPISMLQLSTLNCTALVRLHLVEAMEYIPESLIQMLEDRSILKTGVGAVDDRDKLVTDYGINAMGCVDLRFLAGRYRKSWGGGGLKKLAEDISGITLDKSDSLRRGNWEEDTLPEAMQTYAAMDSEAGLAIFLCLVALKLRTTPELETENIELLLAALQKRSGALCQGIVDLKYSFNPMKKGGNGPSAQRVPNSNPNKSLISTNALRTKAMYSNCVMQAPDGQVLCVCDAKKAQWYCEKELADMVSQEGDEEMVIRLRFEPRGRPSGERDYYRSRKENICVVCGADKSFIRKNIIPREYRKHFPEILKSHSSHDVVLLCASCHKKSGAYDQQFKAHFAQICNAPYKSGGVTIDADLKKVKSAARTLSGYADKIPSEKLEECRQIICQFYGTEEITDDVLESACKLEDRISDNEAPSHGYLVVKHMTQTGQLQHFERLWRQRFVDTMKPQCLHEMWRVDYDHLKMSNEPLEHGRVVVQFYIEKETIQEFQRLWRQRFVEVMKPEHLGDYWHIDYNHLDYLWVKDGETVEAVNHSSSE